MGYGPFGGGSNGMPEGLPVLLADDDSCGTSDFAQPVSMIVVHMGDHDGLQVCRLTDVEEGAVVFTSTPDESVYNPIGMVHGGMACTMLDSAAGCAVHSTLPAGAGYSFIEIKVTFMRPIHADGSQIYARGRVTKSGRRVSFAEAQLTDAEGVVLATATSSCLIMAP